MAPLTAAALPGGTFTNGLFAHYLVRSGALAAVRRKAIDDGWGGEGFLDNFRAIEISAAEFAKKLTAANGSEGDNSAAVASQSPRDLSASEAAPLLGLQPRGVRYACKQGLLEGFKVGRDWRIPHQAIDKYNANREDQR